MRNNKIKISQDMLLFARIDVYPAIADKYATPLSALKSNATDMDKLNFKLDRLFTVIHCN